MEVAMRRCTHAGTQSNLNQMRATNGGVVRKEEYKQHVEKRSGAAMIKIEAQCSVSPTGGRAAAVPYNRARTATKVDADTWVPCTHPSSGRRVQADARAAAHTAIIKRTGSAASGALYTTSGEGEGVPVCDDVAVGDTLLVGVMERVRDAV